MKQFPFRRQHDSMQCGITCLQMICKYYGRDYSINILSKYCSTKNDGTSLLGISEAATKLGLQVVCGATSIDQLKFVQLPCILYWENNHFVVLYRIKNQRKKANTYCIADPNKGLLEYSQDEFYSKWANTDLDKNKQGMCMFVDTTPNFYSLNAGQSLNENRSFSFLLGYIKQYKTYFFQIGLGLLFGCIVQLIFPFLRRL